MSRPVEDEGVGYELGEDAWRELGEGVGEGAIEPRRRDQTDGRTRWPRRAS